MINLVLGALGVFGKLGGKLIEDKDKKTEFAFKTLEIGQKFMEVMLNTKTYPQVDALVKLSYAGEQIVKGLLRPIGSFLMAGFAVYAELNGIELSEPIQILLFGAPVGWGVSRHQEKKAKAKKQIVEEDEDW